MQQKTFGKNPTGQRLERIKKSPNYKNDSFQNLSPTEVLREGASYLKMMKAMLTRPKTVEPPSPMPSVQTNLKTVHADKPLIVWFGHSSYLIKSKLLLYWLTRYLAVTPHQFPFLVSLFRVRMCIR